MARWIPLAASVLFLPSTALALDAFGGSIRGHGGIVNTGNALHPASGITAPAPIGGMHPRVEGTRGAGGLSSELFLGFDGIRVGLTSTLVFGDSPSFAIDPLANGFQASADSLLASHIELFVGRSIKLGPVRPYVDLRGGLGIYQTQIKLNHPTFGYLGETPYVAYRGVFGPRVGVQIPLASVFFLDVGGEASVFGFIRATGFAGFGAVLQREEPERESDHECSHGRGRDRDPQMPLWIDR